MKTAAWQDFVNRARRTGKLMVAAAGLASIAYAATAVAQEPAWTLADTLGAHPSYRGKPPKKSDVIFSTRTDREGALEVAKSFQATRIEWVYTSNAEFLKEAVATFGWFGGAVNATQGFAKLDGRAIDFDGNAIVPPWMKFWDARLITTTSPEARHLLGTHVQRYVKAGARSIQFDDPLIQWGSAIWGGDFSPSSLAGFRQFLSKDVAPGELTKLGIADPANFDYRQYLTERHGIRTNAEYVQKMQALPTTPLWRKYLRKTVLDYFGQFRESLSRQPVPLAFSINLSILDRPSESNPHFEFLRFIDYSMPETPLDKGAADQFMRAAMYRAFGVGYTPSPRPLGKDPNRHFISLSYALGANPLVPWDVYVNQGEGAAPSRFYGKSEDYGDLYRFVRANATLFDDYEPAAVLGVVIPVSKYRDKETMQLLGKLVAKNVPFALLLSGRRDLQASLSAKKLQSVRHWVTLNPLNEFDPNDRALLADAASRQVQAESLSDVFLQGLSFAEVLNTQRQPLILPRARLLPNGELSVIVHIVDSSAGSAPANKSCTRTVKINGAHMKGWRRGTISSSAPLEGTSAVDANENEIRIGCEAWTVLRLTYSKAR